MLRLYLSNDRATSLRLINPWLFIIFIGFCFTFVLSLLFLVSVFATAAIDKYDADKDVYAHKHGSEY